MYVGSRLAEAAARTSLLFPERESPGASVIEFSNVMADKAPALTPEQAGVRVQRLRVRLGELHRGLESVDRLAREVLALIVELHEGRAWLAYGLKTWDQLVVAQRLVLPPLSDTEKVEVVRFLLENSLSHRAIKKVTGFSLSQISGHRSALVAQGVKFPEIGRGLDGKNRRVARAEPGSSTGEVLPGQLPLPLEVTGRQATPDEVEAFLNSVAEAPLSPSEVVAKLKEALEDGLLPAMEQLESAVAAGTALPHRVRASLQAVDRQIELAYQRWRSVSPLDAA